jgi:hypothetical protein
MQANTSSPDAPKKQRGYILRHWNGELSLPLSFWVNGVLLEVLFDIAVLNFIFSLRFAGPLTDGMWISIWAVIVVTTVVTVWQLVGIWRSSYQYLGRRQRSWSRLARLAVIVGWLKWLRTTWTLILGAGGSV